jgi:hypothetical protein
MKKVLSMITAATTAIMMFISCNEGQAFTDGEDAGEEFVKTYSESGNDPVKLKETTVKIIEKATVYMSDSILIQSFLKGARNKMEGHSSETAGAFFGIWKALANQNGIQIAKEVSNYSDDAESKSNNKKEFALAAKKYTDLFTPPAPADCTCQDYHTKTGSNR